MTTTTTTPEMANRVSKIQKMLNQASCPGATTAEAEAFMGKAQQLIEKWNITAAMLAVEENLPETDEPIVKREIYNRNKGKMPTWILTLSTGAAEANRCKHWYSSSRKHGFIAAAGTEANLVAFELIMPFLVSEVERLYQEEKPSWLDRGQGRRWATSFRNGCASRVTQRLREACKKAADDMKNEAGGNRDERYKLAVTEGDTEALFKLDSENREGQQFALAKIETALVKLEKDKERTEEWVEKNMKLGKGNARNQYGTHLSAFAAGRSAGNRASLSGPKGRIA